MIRDDLAEIIEYVKYLSKLIDCDCLRCPTIFGRYFNASTDLTYHLIAFNVFLKVLLLCFPAHFVVRYSVAKNISSRFIEYNKADVTKRGGECFAR